MIEYKIRVGIPMRKFGQEQYMAGKGNLRREIDNE